jgi:UDP-3-O-[3-hydroxymyristoyl] N-acetylglucosamine deacetylase / 3-hydroxyacyl-[acyl-carrier-protein] dehydratase
MKQLTVKDAITISGVGLHSGKMATITIKPASENYGIEFVRTDLEKNVAISAIANNVSSTDRSTTLAKGGVNIQTVEHLLAALAGLQIDNVIIEVEGEEIPILDGSALPFIQAILEKGVQALEAQRTYFVVEEIEKYVDADSGVEITVLPSDKFEVTTLVDFDSPYVSTQFASLRDIANFKEEIAPARTFGFIHELEALLDAGLIQGGSLDNALVFADKHYTEEELASLAKKMNRETASIDSKGVLNISSLRFDNEPARHKLLDLIGDLALVGKPIQAKIIANKPGHAANVAIAKVLRNLYQKQRKIGNIPKYDPRIEPIKNSVQIEAMLPHRHPFLLVDKIIEQNEKYIVGIKNVTHDEYFFKGHFPNNPVMPGVLQIEAMAQTGGILALSTVADPENWDTYFLKIDNCKFKKKVVPGDTIIMKLEFLSPIRRGICNMMGTAYVGESLVSEAELTAQIIRRKVD